MRKLLGIVVLCVIAAAIAFGEEAAVIPEQTLRLNQNEDFGSGGEFMHSWGVGAEYGIRDWLNVQFLWNRYLKIAPDIGTGSMFLGVKTYIVGEDALLSTTGDKFRLSLALGLLIPPTDVTPDPRDQDQNLWGTVFRVYGDYIINQYVYINAFYEWDFYPPQYQNDNVEAYRDWVRHYQDYTLEIEGHFQIPLENGFILKGGVPFRFFCAPYMNASDGLATSQYFIATGTYFGIQFPNHSPPAEVYLRYTVPLIGQNIRQIHQVSLIHKVTIPNEMLKFRLKDKTVSSEELAVKNEEEE